MSTPDPITPTPNRVSTLSFPRLPLLGPALAAVLGILLAEYFSLPIAWLLAMAGLSLVAVFVRFGTPVLLIAVASAFALAHTR